MKIDRTTPFALTEGRHFSKLEQQMIWQKPVSHQTSQEELRIAQEIKLNWQDPEMKIFNVLLEGDAGSGKTQLAKALSYDLQLPYTKITCFADMDKSDVFGALLPIVATDQDEDSELLEAIYLSDSLDQVIQVIADHYSITTEGAREKLADLIRRMEETDTTEVVHYKFYPSEIVRAMEKGYLLEVQEPTVIRDASVLVALNSALEQNGMLNLPTGVVRRHPDCVVIITTNRNYQGNRPLNESLRDRMQHAEKMDLPELSVMVARALAKTGYEDQAIASKMAEIIRLLDSTAKANAIKGVAGMRSYFYWLNTVKNGQSPLETFAVKVLYKLTTDPDELHLLQEALDQSELLVELRRLYQGQEMSQRQPVQGRILSAKEADARNIEESSSQLGTVAATEETAETPDTQESNQEDPAVPKEKIAGDTLESQHSSEDGQAQEGSEQASQAPSNQHLSIEEFQQLDKELRKQANQEARQALKHSLHTREGLIVHRPKLQEDAFQKAQQLLAPLLPVVDTISKQLLELLENEAASSYGKGKYSGSRFDASRVAYGDFRTFDKKNPPHEQPSLAIALRIDESGSMVREGRMTAAQQAALAVNAFAQRLEIPLMIYGDTADLSLREKTSLYSYKEFSEPFDYVPAKLMSLQPRQNNRDGAVLRVLAEKLVQQSATTKLLLTISDGQPKAMPDYTGNKAKADIQSVIKEYERQEIIFLSAAIGQDKEVIKEIYGAERYIDISSLKEFPKQLLALISRYF
ncbi:AAA family ATPase [Enterococcus sp.]|uniref:AAA family ATPase n=1 Tax=Enterococcus sp. TaxID=35783 RepID=UPI0025C66FFC|nr:AAA family ATPase [Enterococcus sp.]